MDTGLRHPLVAAAFAWATATKDVAPSQEQYCESRDHLNARMERLRSTMMKEGISETTAFLLHAILSEIGGNSFDHNIGQWRDIPGAFFGHATEEKELIVALADRGQGIRTTLQRVRPSMRSDEEALRVAFLERISGRAPERRGNGLKFVRQTIMEDGIDLFFQSGAATYSLEEKRESWGRTEEQIPGCFATLTIRR